MKKGPRIALCVLGIFLLLGGAFVGGVYFSLASNRKVVLSSIPVSAPPTETTNVGETELYTSDQLRFSIQYPIYLNEIQEVSDRVTFRIKDDPGMFGSGFSVLTEKVPYNTTEEWLRVQPKGAVSKGVDEVVWLNRSSDAIATVFVSQYVVYEHDGDGRSIYRKGLYAVCVNNGMLYKVPLTPSGSFRADEKLFITEDQVKLASSLHVW